jgi:hypothetical protein
LAVVFLAVDAAAPSVAVSDQSVASKQVPPDSEGALRDLCRGKDLCWLLVMTPPRGGAFIVQARFPPAERFIRPEDAYCDRREYWHVVGSTHTLLASDCAEQWGPDSQGPVDLSVEGLGIKLTYVEWEYDNQCEKTVALLDFGTAKLISSKRWAGVASRDRKDCRRQRPLKSLPHGDGRTTPLVIFNSDSAAER